MKKVIFVEFKPQAASKEHELAYVTERLKVSVSNDMIHIIQFMHEPREVMLTSKEFKAVVLAVSGMDFPEPKVVTKEIKTHVPQKVIQADFSNKSFQKAYEVETIEVLQESEGNHQIISSGRISVTTWKNKAGHECIHVTDGNDFVCFYQTTFQKLVDEVTRQEEKMECKVLTFSKSALQKAS